MIIFRRLLAGFLMVLALCAFLYAGRLGFNFDLPEAVLTFNDADAIHKSVYFDKDISKLLEQNLRMQEAVLAAQKEGFRSIINNERQTQLLTGRIFIYISVLLVFSVFCQIAALLIYPRVVKLDNHTLAQLEMLLWESWVTDKPRGGANDEFSVQKSAYPVHLCGCSSSGVPVHLCGCSDSAIPVHLCGCSSGYLDSCCHVPPVNLCGCGKI